MEHSYSFSFTDSVAVIFFWLKSPKLVIDLNYGWFGESPNAIPHSITALLINGMNDL